MSLAAEADFGLSLLREISFNSTTVLSPLSIALALSLVHAGAKGNSKDQIKNVLCKESTHEDCAKHFSLAQKRILQKDDSDDSRLYGEDFGVHVNIANRIFIGNDINIKEDYLCDIASTYDSTAESVDFTNPSLAAEIVNGYVKKETNGQIEELVTKETFEGGLTKALIVNAMFFQARWYSEFSTTEEDKFFVKEEETKQVTFMKQDSLDYLFSQDDDFMALSLRFEGDKSFLFTMLLPKQRFGLSSALRTLSGERLVKLISPKESTLFNLAFPKFKKDDDISLPGILKKLGITDPFIKDKADLTGISGDPLFISDAQQKVTIDVNEKGCSAAAATFIQLFNSSGAIDFNPPEPIDFIADHPFLFVISQAGHILFTGQYYG